MYVSLKEYPFMNKSKLIAVGAGIGLLAAGAFSFEYYKVTGWTDERIDPYTLRAVCKPMTMVSVFGKVSVREGATVPNSQCRESINYWSIQEPHEGCSVNIESMTVTCQEVYEHPFF